jgi:hypothetical protein
MPISLSTIRRSSVLMGMALFSSLPTPAQTPLGCALNYVGADLRNPFTAEYVTNSTTPDSDGRLKSVVMKENVARDSQSRIRFEKHGVGAPADDRKTITLQSSDGTPFTVTREEYGTLITISDCQGNVIQIQPGLRIASVRRIPTRKPRSTPPVRRPYSSSYLPSTGAKFPPSISNESLGFREIQGLQAIGVKTTTLGSESDGEWNGRPISETELWLSDDLCVQLLKISKDFRRKLESRSELLSIKRDEPDPTLFEIPRNYEINSTNMPTFKN